jgi:RhtB (resistance to homoserine/threonine) family protein
MSAFLTVAFVHLLGVMSPGPDFILTTKNSLVFSRRSGMLTALGLGCGMLAHSAYCVVGIGLIVSRSILLFNTLKYIGAAYLIFIGWKALMSKGGLISSAEAREEKDLAPWAAFRMGFLCNVLNPKATLFVFALFTQVIDPSTPAFVQAFYGLYMGMATVVWFSFVASVLSLPVVRRPFERMQGAIERFMGAVLILLGIRVAFATRR